MQESPDEILSMNREQLKRFRTSFFLTPRHDLATMEQRKALLDFMILLTMVQDVRAWSELAEPGLAPKLFDLGEEWEPEIEKAREIDRMSLDDLSRVWARFQAAGGKDALAAAIDRLNDLTR